MSKPRKTDRVYGAKTRAILRVARKHSVTAKDFPQWDRRGTVSLLRQMWLCGHLEKIKRGYPGPGGALATYQLNKV